MIRQMKEADLKRVADIWLRATICAHYFIPAEFWCSKLDKVKKKELMTGERYVYEEDGLIKGFITFATWKDSYIENLYVEPKDQGNGIGHALLEHARKDKTYLELHVYKQNSRAVQFYNRRGFVEVDTHTELDTGKLKLKMTWNKKQAQGGT